MRILEQGDHIVSQMNYSNRQAAHERVVAQHLGKIEMLKAEINTMKDMGMTEAAGAAMQDLLKLVRQPLPDPPSPYQEPSPRKRPSSSTHAAVRGWSSSTHECWSNSRGTLARLWRTPRRSRSERDELAMMMTAFNEHPAFVPPPYGEGDDTNDDWSEDDEIHEGRRRKTRRKTTREMKKTRKTRKMRRSWSVGQWRSSTETLREKP